LLEISGERKNVMFPNEVRSIQTYGRRGVPGRKIKMHHAIVYTGTNPPQPLENEIPKFADEPPMGQPIRVISHKAYDNMMDPRSRISFNKLYTVEHNVKVEDFGHVDPNDMKKFTTQFDNCWRASGSSSPRPGERTT
jgi:hypothetical protein